MPSAIVGDLGGFGAIAEFAKGVLDRLIPDPAAKADAILKLQQMQQTGELAQLAADTSLATGQLEVNKAEATSGSMFVAGARPFILWVCGVTLAWQYLMAPLLTWGTMLAGHPTPFPQLGNDELQTLLFGLLGLGTMRTVEHVTGSATKTISK